MAVVNLKRPFNPPFAQAEPCPYRRVFAPVHALSALPAPHSAAIARGVSEPLLTRQLPKGRGADRIAAGVAALALVLSVLATAWFFAGFVENDPEFRASSSALLLSLGLGTFAIVPSAVVMRLAWRAYREGFTVADGLWTLMLMGPWVGLGALLLRSPLPGWVAGAALGLAALLCLWALVSLWLERRAPSGR